MEKVIYIVIVLTEIVCFILKCSSKKKIIREQDWAMVGIFLLYSVLCLCHVIHFGVQHFLLDLYLVIRGVISGIHLIKNTQSKKVYYALPGFFGMLGRCILVYLLMIPMFLFPQYEPLKTTGPYHIATACETYIDESRTQPYGDTGEARELNVEFWYPTDCTESCPLLVFSHGTLGVKNTGESLFRELASQGYVVCSIDHPYEAAFTRNSSGNVTLFSKDFYNEFQTVGDNPVSEESIAIIRRWMDVRTADINYVLDTILAKAQSDDAEGYYALVDPDRLVLGGHSFGGAGVAAVCRMRDDIDGAIIMEAPYFGDITGVDGDAYTWDTTPYTMPIINIYSDSTWDQFDTSPLYQQNTNLLGSMQEEPVYTIYIRGAGHLGLTDLSMMAPGLTNLLDGNCDTNQPSENMETINEEVELFLDGLTW